jgi:DNA modification methylase
MTPYYDHAGITIYHGDCREILPTLSMDVMITDPPYGIRLAATSGSSCHSLTRLSGYASFDDSYDSFVGIVVPALNAALGIVKRAAVFTGPHIHEQQKPAAIGGIYCPAACGRTCWGFRNFLPVLFYGIAPDLRNGCRHTVILSTEVADRVGNNHPVPKPIGWMRWLITLASLPGEVVLDPFMGSGTTLRAAKDLNRRAIGIEIEERYCELAVKRLRQEVFAFDPPREERAS